MNLVLTLEALEALSSCTMPTGAPIARKEPEKAKGVDVKGYPTLLYSDANGRVTEYSGPRTADGFMEFLKTKILS